MFSLLFAAKRNSILISAWMYAACLCAAPGSGERITILVDQPYMTGESLTAYEQERCNLDVYLPNNRANFPTVVWFHGGSLTGGNKGFPLDPNSKDWIEDMGQRRTYKLHFRVSGRIRQGRVTGLMSSRARAGRAGRRFRRAFFEAPR